MLEMDSEAREENDPSGRFLGRGPDLCLHYIKCAPRLAQQGFIAKKTEPKVKQSALFLFFERQK